MTETRLCKNPECKAEYEPKYYELMGTKILRGNGYCPVCARRESERLEAKEEAATLADIARRRREARKRTGIPPKYTNENFSTFKKGKGKEIDAALKLCWAYAEEYPLTIKRPQGYRSLYIYSEQSWGVGKTHLSCAIAHRILDKWTGQMVQGGYGFEVESSPPRVRWVSEPQLFSKIEASFNYTAEDKQIMPNKDDILNDLINADLLILDDVGKEKRADPRFVQRTLFALINGRYDLDLPMVITANLKPTLLKGHLGSGGTDEASYDRLLEMCRGKRVPIDGDSYRRKK